MGGRPDGAEPAGGTGRDGKTFLQRMVFYNISDHALDWNWERSDDGGATWNPLWVIHYTRRG